MIDVSRTTAPFNVIRSESLIALVADTAQAPPGALVADTALAPSSSACLGPCLALQASSSKYSCKGYQVDVF